MGKHPDLVIALGKAPKGADSDDSADKDDVFAADTSYAEHAKAVLSAVKEHDAEALSAALMAFVDMCNESKHDEE